MRRFTAYSHDQIEQHDSKISALAKTTWSKYSLLEKFDVTRHEVEEIEENARKCNLEAKETFELRFVRHVECKLARNMYTCDNLTAYLAASSSIRDILFIDWGDTQQRQALENKKRVYYFSLEFLVGRAMDNALINKGLENPIEKGISGLGFKFEDVLEQEPDAGLGNGGLGRLAACFLDSLSSRNYSGWGYGINYKYGIFHQSIVNGYQVESPDTWQKYGSSWEVHRYDNQIAVDLYGWVEEIRDNSGYVRKLWRGGEQILAQACDYPIPGFLTRNCNNLRLWNAQPTKHFDFHKFNQGEYADSVASLQKAESISAVLYPNDNFEEGKELRLKQEYFWVAASLQDIIRRFIKNKYPWEQLPEHVAIQLNDTHPAIAIPELMRLLVDIYRVKWNTAWDITTQVFAFTNHTVMKEALEKWPVTIVENLLPRHLQIIYEINDNFLQEVSTSYPGDIELLRSCSIIEEEPIKSVRMGHLAVVGSHTVNGVAELHSFLVKSELFPQFVKVFGFRKFVNVTNGITPRRWLRVANPKLTELIGAQIGDHHLSFLTQLNRITSLQAHLDDLEFVRKWDQVKIHNKLRVADLIDRTIGIKVDPASLFDIHVKRIHEYKRQHLNIFAIIYRFIHIKELLAQGISVNQIKRQYYSPTVSIFGGIAAPGYYMAKTIIHLINSAASVINADSEVAEIMKVVFIPAYNVSKAEILVAGSDISNHISTAGTEASGTSNMKFALNGGLILGTVDGANIEIIREIGETNVFTFGARSEEIEAIRAKNRQGVKIPSSLLDVFAAIDSGKFGDPNEFRSLLDSIRVEGDYYLVSADFESFLAAHRRIEKEFNNDDDEEVHINWVKKCIRSVANMGYFSSDRAVDEYAEKIWHIEKEL